MLNATTPQDLGDDEGKHACVVRDPPSSGSLLQTFSTPFNWCDRRCDRCPLADECPVYHRERQRRWVHEARGEDPDSMAVALTDVEEEFARALALLRAIASEEGIDCDASPPMPISLDEVKLRRAGLHLTLVLHAALKAPRAEPQPVLPVAVADEAMMASATLAAKCARVGSYLAECHDDVWIADAVPNLLLMERLRAQLDDALASIETVLGAARLNAVRDARRDLDRILDPLLDSVHSTERRVLAELVARGAAPSPFSITEP
jgi:hypothetical protein